MYGITPVFLKNYYAFKAKNPDGSRKYKYIINRGSSRSSKTFSIIELKHRICENNPNWRATAWRDTKKDAKDTIWNDFQKVLKMSGRFVQDQRNKTESSYFYPSTQSSFEIHGADDEEKVHGLTQNSSWLNEPYKITQDTFDQIDQRSDLMFIDWNPKKSHWVEKLSERSNAIVIHSTYKDNPFCPPEQLKKIESYQPVEFCDIVRLGKLTEQEAKSYNFDYNLLNFTPYEIEELKRCLINEAQGSANRYKWQVYGLGEKAEVEGRIYNWKKIPYSDYLKIDKRIIVGVDWGEVDPFAIVEMKYHDGNLYVHELNYKSESEIRGAMPPTQLYQINAKEEGLVPYIFTQRNISKSHLIVCDNNRPNKTLALRRAGWEQALAVGGKSRLLDRIYTLQGLNIFYTDESPNIEYEQENYSYKKDKYGKYEEEPIDQDNHTIDAIAYGVQQMFTMGIIKNL